MIRISKYSIVEQILLVIVITNVERRVQSIQILMLGWNVVKASVTEISDWWYFLIWLVEKEARVFWANHSKAK